MALLRAGWIKPVQDRAAHGAGKENNVVMGTKLSAEGSGEERNGLQADLSWNLVPGRQLPPGAAGKHQSPHFHGRNDGFAAALCCFVTLCWFCRAPGL